MRRTGLWTSAPQRGKLEREVSVLRTLLAWAALMVASPAFAGPGTLAVLYFEGGGNPQLEPLKVGLTQMLITDLRGTEGVTLVERTQLQAVLDELQLGHQGIADPATAAQVGKLLGAEWLLLGSYFEMFNTLSFTARLVKVETSEILHAEQVSGVGADFLRMEKELAKAVQAGLLAERTKGATRATPAPMPHAVQPPANGSLLPQPATPGSRAAAPALPVVVAPDAHTLAAAVSYSEGLISLDRKEVDRAREHFQAALASDPALTVAKAELEALKL